MHHRLDNTSDSIILSNPNILASGDYGNTAHSNNNSSSDGNNNSTASLNRERTAPTNASDHTNQDPSAQHLQLPPVDLPSCLVAEQGAGDLAAIIPSHRQSTASHQPHGGELPLEVLPAPSGVTSSTGDGKPDLPEITPLHTGTQQQRHQSVKQEYLGMEPEYSTVATLAADAKSSQLLLHRPIHQLLRD